MKGLYKMKVARKITGLSEEEVAKVLAFMDEMEADQAGNSKNSFAPNGRGDPGMRRIALRGMIGRKRDTVLLWTVIVLTFLFLALPTTLITSLNATDAVQREQTYGKWQVMAAGLSVEGAEELAAAHGEGSASTPVIEVSGADYFQGDNTYALGVYSPELVELGSLQLREGRWPEARSEVVLEYSRMVSLGLEVGDAFKVQCQLALDTSYADGPVPSGLWGVDELSVRLAGAWGEQSASLIYEYTVCGVIESYSDRWDSGRSTLPSGFVTAENFALLQAGRGLAAENSPGGVLEDFQFLVLLAGGKSTGSLYAEVLPDYNADLPMDEQSGWLTARLTSGAAAFAGFPTSYRNFTAQIAFDFLLADEDAGQFLPVTAWLHAETEPGPATFLYWNRGLLTEAEVPYGYSSDPISLTDLHLTGSSRFLFLRTDVLGCNRDNAVLFLNLENSVVAIDWDGEQYEIPFAAFMAADFQVDGMFPASPRHTFALSESQDAFAALRVNSLAYPSSVEGAGSMLMIVMGMLFVTAVCAVFQICFTQIRRRMKRIVLLKSLGAETKQIAGMMAWEFLYFWASAMPAGTVLGLGGAWLAAKILSETQERTVLLTIEPAVLLLALLAGTLALAIGMMIPAIMAIGVPLTGRTVRRKPLAPPKKDVRQDFFHVSLRGLAARKGRTIGSFALCTFMMAITVLCLFLGFRFLSEYRDTVVRDGKPDYLLRSPYAMSTRQRTEYLEELEELGVCGGITSYFIGENINLDGSGLEESVLFRVAAGDGNSCSVNLYTLSSGDALFSDFQDAATVGHLDKTAFDNGTEVLLAVPLYRDSGKVHDSALAAAEGWARLAAAGVETSFLAEYDGVFQRDGAVQVGDTLQLAVTTSRIEEDYYVTTEQAAAVTVGAVLYYFPDTGIWPLSGSGEGYQLVASPQLLARLLPDSCTTRKDQAVRAISLQQNGLSPLDGVYGVTDFYITIAGGAEKDAADTALLVFARKHYMDIEVYHESSTALLRSAVNNILLACLLGMSAVLLALVIFYNTVSSDIEQERPRIGILQSLGVSNRRFAARQAAVGAVAAGIAAAAANVLLWGGVLLFVCATGTVLGNLLWGYPALWHVCLCAGLACILISLFVLPVRRLCRYLPIENIQSKK